MPKTPEDYGIPYKTVNFASKDGVYLSAWEMDQGSEKLAVFSHPLKTSKYGYVPSAEDKSGMAAVNFIDLYKVLYKDGFNVFAYDFRS